MGPLVYELNVLHGTMVNICSIVTLIIYNRTTFKYRIITLHELINMLSNDFNSIFRE